MLPAGPNKLGCVYSMCPVLNAGVSTTKTHIKTYNFGQLLDNAGIPGFSVGILPIAVEPFPSWRSRTEVQRVPRGFDQSRWARYCNNSSTGK